MPKDGDDWIVPYGFWPSGMGEPPCPLALVSHGVEDRRHDRLDGRVDLFRDIQGHAVK
jgi:hypothetical protein